MLAVVTLVTIAVLAQFASLAEAAGSMRGVEEIQTITNSLEANTKVGPIPTTTLSNGVEMPMMGLGTWEYNNSVAYGATLTALKVGYTHVDTATIYGNHKGVGEAISTWRKSNGGIRENLFVTTKIPGGLNYSASQDALEASLEDLGLDYVDLMLMHFPAGMDGSSSPEIRIAGYKAIIDFYKAGKARAIGVSHFCKRHILELMHAGLMVPHVNQVEFHVGMGNAGPNATDDREFDNMVGTLYESFSPLCGPCNTMELITGELVTSIGKKYGKSGAQVSLKWQVQQGIPVIPKSDNEEHIIANAQLFDWELSAEDMVALTQAKSPPVTGGGDNLTSGDCAIP